MDMNQAGAELLEVVKQGLVASGKAITTQLPVLCEQVLRWGIVSNICTIILSIFIMGVCYFLTRLGLRIGKQNDELEYWAFLFVSAIIVGIIFMIMFWCSLFEIGKILSAPNVYILDYFKGLVTTSK